MIPANIAIWEHMSIGVAIVDDSGTCVYMNRIQRQIDGFADTEVVGKHISELYLPNDMLRIPTVECLRLGEPILRKAYAYRTAGNLVYNSVEDFFPLFDKGRKDGVLSFCIWSDNTPANSDAKRLPAPRSFKAETNTRYTFESIVGRDTALRGAVNDARAAAQNTANVMIWGESGTGKELFAQAIHSASPRHQRPFVAVNCAAIPENLLEGLLFGTVKGAYTDAADSPGLFEKADGGTILLDELNSMPLGLQAKLLRVIQEKCVRRVGSQVEKRIDVRVISVLNEAPLSAVAHGILRRDLYYRLAVVGISVPPLRDRLEDIPLLISTFLEHNNAHVEVDDEVLQLFWNCRWPGNIRELLHVIEGSLVLLGDRKVITKDCLPRQFIEAYGRHGGNGSEEKTALPAAESNEPAIYDYSNIRRSSVVPLKEKLNAYESRCIRNVLRVTGGNVAKAGRILEITGPGLRYKMKQLGIEEDDY